MDALRKGVGFMMNRELGGGTGWSLACDEANRASRRCVTHGRQNVRWRAAFAAARDLERDCGQAGGDVPQPGPHAQSAEQGLWRMG